MSDSESRLSLRKGWPAVLLMAGMVFLAAYSRLLISPLLVRIAQELQISFEAATDFFLAMSGGFVVALLLSGYVSSRLLHRGAIILSGFLTALGLFLCAVVVSKEAFMVCLFLLGIGPGIYAGSGLPATSALIRRKEVATAIAVHELGPILGFVAAPITVALLGPDLGRAGVLAIAGGVCLIVTLLYVFLGKGGDGRGAPPSFHTLRRYLGSARFVLMLVIFVLAAACAFGVYQVLPGYLIVFHGLDPELVNTLVGASRVSGVAVLLFSGRLADRIGNRRIIAWSLVITGTLTLGLGLLSGAPLLVVVFLQPFLMPAFFPAALSQIASLSDDASQNIGLALVITGANLVGNGVFPRLTGSLQSAGFFNLAFVILGVAVLLVTIPAWIAFRRW